LTRLLQWGVPAALLVIGGLAAAVAAGTAGPEEEPDRPTQVAMLMIHRSTVPFIREYIRDHSVPRGQIKKIREGSDGCIVSVYRDTFENGVKVKRELVYQAVRPAESELYLVGVEGYRTSRGSFAGRKVMEMLASGYDPGPRSCGRYANGYTYTGVKAEYGVVAVDPKVIPLGTRLYIEGYGYAIAADIGSGIKGNRIDLCFPTWKQADKYGLKKVRVHILE
jgi:3D (Asp-Asp-Asp) domain-containing protein